MSLMNDEIGRLEGFNDFYPDKLLTRYKFLRRSPNNTAGVYD